MIQAELTQDRFEALSEKLRVQEGITLKGTGGMVEKSGATVAWSFLQGLLSLDVIRAPFGLKGVVEGKLRDALAANGVVPR